MKIKCTKCGSANFIKNGKQKGVQRYKCQNCNRTFSENSANNKFTKTEKRLLSMLLLFLRNEYIEGQTLSDLLKNSKAYLPRTNKIGLTERKWSGNTITCCNPRLVICEDGDEITFIKIPNSLTTDTKNETIRLHHRSALVKN